MLETDKDIEVAIILLNWKGLDDTIECVDSLDLMDYEDYHIYLIDNGSGEEEQRQLHALFAGHPRITLVFHEENLGFTEANNRMVSDLIKKKDYKFFVLLNNDTVVTPGWLKNLVFTAKSKDSDMVSSFMINYYDRSLVDNAGHIFLNTGEILPLGNKKDRSLFSKMNTNVGACGGAALYCRKMINEIGLFDPFFDTGYEDAEFGLRACLLGYKSLFDAEAVVFHKVSRSIKKIKNEDYICRIQRNIFYTYIKLMPKGFLLVNSVFVLFKYISLMIFGILTMRVALLRVHFKTIYLFLTKDIQIALRNRREYFSRFRMRQVAPNSIIFPAKFFIWTDFKRALNLIFNSGYQNKF